MIISLMKFLVALLLFCFTVYTCLLAWSVFRYYLDQFRDRKSRW